MPDLYRTVLKPLLFTLEAERAHRLIFALGRAFGGLAPRVPNGLRDQPVDALGLRFPNRVGLAAGMDKNAELLPLWKRIGFGFVEVGTVTPRPQPGNPRPRLFRLPLDRALLNRMGFNNGGAEAIARRLEKRPEGLLVGLNVGKNKDTPNETAENDYAKAFGVLQDSGDYAVVNVSSPNTPGLRALQEKDALERILAAVQAVNQNRRSPLPLLLKIAPELTPTQLEEVLAVARTHQLAGIIATNTLAPSPLLLTSLKTPVVEVAALGQGGLSGPLLQPRSPEMVRFVARTGMPVIGVGGIHDRASAQLHLDAGASLVQLYTGLVYRGPGLVRELLEARLAATEPMRAAAG